MPIDAFGTGSQWNITSSLPATAEVNVSLRAALGESQRQLTNALQQLEEFRLALRVEMGLLTENEITAEDLAVVNALRQAMENIPRTDTKFVGIPTIKQLLAEGAFWQLF